MKQSLAILIYDFADGDFRLLYQVGLECILIVLFDELGALTVDLSQPGLHLTRLLHLLHMLVGMRPSLLVNFHLVVLLMLDSVHMVVLSIY